MCPVLDAFGIGSDEFSANCKPIGNAKALCSMSWKRMVQSWTIPGRHGQPVLRAWWPWCFAIGKKKAPAFPQGLFQFGA